MRWKARVGALILIASIAVALSEALGAAASLMILGAGVGLGWLLVPDLWRTMIQGGIGGLLAGLIVLGPGLRAIMRLVAVIDPARTTEFTVGGTMFILLGVGAGMGAILGLVGGVVRKGFDVRWSTAGIIIGLLVMVLLLIDDELRSELFHLGAGPWLNIPMFTAVAAGYGIMAMWVARRLDAATVTASGKAEIRV